MPSSLLPARLLAQLPVRRGDSPWLAMLFVASLLWTLPACDVTVGLPNDNGSEGSDGGDAEPPATIPDPIITLHLANRTDFVVEPQIFVSTNGPGATAETLFVESNGFTEGIGLAASGLMAPDSVDVAEVKCVEGLVIGTTGGRFLDAETGDELGIGLLRILQEGLVFDCGAEIALIFRLENGEFTTSVALE